MRSVRPHYTHHIMQFIHAREYLNDGDVIRVTCDTQCNVMLTSDTEFDRFKRGEGCTYRGGFYRKFPAVLVQPHSGYWNVTLDVGEGYEASIKYSIVVIKKP